jgi:seryl-tRNA synthetase
MLDIKLIRENPEFVKENLAKRGNPENDTMLNQLINVDREWRQNLTKLNDLRHERKLVTIEIAKLKKAGQKATAEVEKAKEIDAEITTVEKQVTAQEEQTREYLMRLPNMLHETVPFGKDDMGQTNKIQLPPEKPHRPRLKPGHSRR